MKRRRGVTLIELLIALALFSLVMAATVGLLSFGLKVNTMTAGEFDMQTTLRVMSQKVNETIRDAAAVFLLHRDNADNLTDEWNYVMLNSDKTQIVEYYWDSVTKTHIERPITIRIDGVVMDFGFTKATAANESNLLAFNLAVNQNGASRNITTQVLAQNSLQVMDRAYGKTANVLAYKIDVRITEVANKNADVAFVLDKSGSMGYTMDGYYYGDDYSYDPADFSRLKLMKTEAVRMITELSKRPNIYVSINPFSTSANASQPMLNAQVNNTTNTGLVNMVNALHAGGGTNTGDGIRRAFYQIKAFNELPQNLGSTNKNFMIILVDGVTTYGSVTRVSTLTSSYYYPSITQNGSVYLYTNYTYSRKKYTYYYKHADYVLGNGNISESMASDNTNYPSGRVYGDGGSLDIWGTNYVDTIGQMVRDYKKETNEAIKVYVIGFSADSSDYDSLQDIAMATTGNTKYYTAGSSAALQDIFSSIQRDISDALWQIGGPD